MRHSFGLKKYQLSSIHSGVSFPEWNSSNSCGRAGSDSLLKAHCACWDPLLWHMQETPLTLVKVTISGCKHLPCGVAQRRAASTWVWSAMMETTFLLSETRSALLDPAVNSH